MPFIYIIYKSYDHVIIFLNINTNFYKKSFKNLLKMKILLILIFVCNFINLSSALTFDVLVLRNKIYQPKIKSKFLYKYFIIILV